MGDFKRNSYSSNRGGSFGGNRGFRGGHGSRPATMHSAVCSNCGKACEVPFKPTGEKPVFCRDCFRERNGDSRDARPQERNFSRPAATAAPAQDYKAQLDALTRKVDKILDILNASAMQNNQNTTDAEVVEEEVVAPQTEKKKKATKKAL